MKNKKLIVAITVFIFCFFSMGSVSFADTVYKSWNNKVDISPNKVWSVNFSVPLNSSDITDSHIYVKDSSSNIIPVTLSVSNDYKNVFVQPLTPYENSKTYTLYVESLTSTSGKAIGENIKMNFTISNSNISSSKYSYGVIKSIDDKSGQVLVNILGQGLVKYDYGDEWAFYENSSIVMFNSTNTLVSYDDKNYKQDNLFDYGNSKLRFSNISGSYDINSDALVVFCDEAGNYLQQGTLSDLSKAAANENFVRALMDTDTGKIKVVVIEK